MRLGKKLLLLALLLLIGVPSLLFLGVVIWSRSSPPDLEKVNEEGLIFVHAPVAPAQNAYFDLEKASATFSQTQDEAALVKDFLGGQKWDKAVIGSLLAKNQPAIEHYLAASRKSNFEDPTLLQQINNKTDIPSIGYMSSISKFMALRGVYLWREGRQREGLEALFQVNDLGLTIQNAQCSVIHYMIGLAISKTSLLAMNQCLQSGPYKLAELKEGVRYLERHDLSNVGMRWAYIVEYHTLTGIVGRGLSGNDSSVLEWYQRLLLQVPYLHDVFYKPNQTKQKFADAFRHRIADLDKPYKEIDQEYTKKIVDSLDLKNPHNLVGNVVVSIALPAYKFESKFFEFKALRAATLANFALHAYKLENKKTAPALSALTPKYLKEPLLDPFDLQPLRYSPQKGLVYSVGKNLTDVGGSEGDDISTMDDLTLRITY